MTCPAKCLTCVKAYRCVYEREIKGDQDMIPVIVEENAEERLAAFINPSRRFAQRGFSPREFRLDI